VGEKSPPAIRGTKLPVIRPKNRKKLRFPKHKKEKKVVKMSIAALLQAAEYLERRDREAEHGYAVSVPSMFGSGFGGGGVESSSSLTSDDHVVPTANNCRGLTGPTTMMIPINNKGAGGGGSNVLAFNGKFNQTNTTNNSHHVLATIKSSGGHKHVVNHVLSTSPSNGGTGGIGLSLQPDLLQDQFLLALDHCHPHRVRSHLPHLPSQSSKQHHKIIRHHLGAPT
jgi:hypothetical protein